MERRTQLEDVRAELEQQTFNLFPSRWKDLYFEESVNQDDEDEEMLTSIDEIDAYFASLENPRKVSGGEIAWAMQDEDGWV